MDQQTWPMQPVHLTSDGDRHAGSELQKLTGLGIIPNEHLQGIQTSICVNLRKNPTTIIEFSPSGESVRTGSELLRGLMRPPCKLFRECTGEHFCDQSDNVHASLLFNLSRDGFRQQVLQRAKQVSRMREYHSNAEILFDVDETASGRPYLEYDCPNLGCRELVFPVFFEDRVLAAFFVGQNGLCGRESFMRQQVRDFLGRSETQQVIEEQFRSLDVSTRKACSPSEVVTALDNWLNDQENLLDAGDLRQLIEEASTQLDEFERTLAEQMDLRREQYVRHYLDALTQEMCQVLDTQSGGRSRTIVVQLWSVMDRLLDDIVAKLGLRFALVFSTDRLTSNGTKPPLLRVVAKGGDLPAEVASHLSDLQLSVSSIDPRYHTHHMVTVDRADPLFDAIAGAPYRFTPSRHRLMVFGVHSTPPRGTVVLLEYRDENSQSEPANASGGRLDRALQSFFLAYEAVLSTAMALETQVALEGSLKIFGHELGNQTKVLERLAVQYFNTPEKLKHLSEDKALDLSGDISAYLNLLDLVSKTAKMAVGEIPTPIKREFWPYGELLFKWKDTYRSEARAYNLQFDMVYPRTSDQDRPQVYGDKRLLELLLYNLVSNAVKYCHRGTKIVLDCKKAGPAREDDHVFTVTDYGCEFKGGTELYGLFTRGPNADPEGLGVGLYVAKRLAEAHGGSLSFTCDRVSEYNVPMIEAYLRWPGASSQLQQILREELQGLREACIYEEIVALDENRRPQYARPSAWDLRDGIREPTFRVTFTVKIPSKEASV